MTIVRPPSERVPSAGMPGGFWNRSRKLALGGCALVICLAVFAVWLYDDLFGQPTVYVVGDSITALSGSAIAASLAGAGYAPTISATPGVKIGQAQADVRNLAQSEPWAWIIELGTDDAGASDATWAQPFLAEWSVISPAACVIYLTISPRAGPVGAQINSSMEMISRAHANVHILDWGQMEYANPAWVSADGIHPTPEGAAALANLEAEELKHACSG